MDIRLKPDKCDRCFGDRPFLQHVDPKGGKTWLCVACVHALIDGGKKALNDRDRDRAGNGG